jgi:hypothetical protein
MRLKERPATATHLCGVRKFSPNVNFRGSNPSARMR